MELRALVKPILSALAVLGAVASIMAVPALFSKAPSLKAEITACQYAVPPGVDEEFSKEKQRISEKSMRKGIKPDTSLDEDKREDLIRQRAWDEAISSVALFVDSNTQGSLPNPYRSMRGFWVGSIQNTGDKTAASVILKIPNSIYFCLQREGEPIACNTTSEILHVGTLQPQESISLQAWSTSRPYSYDYADVRLTFSEGVGSISISGPASPFWQWMDKNWPFLCFYCLTVLVILVILAAYYFENIKSVPLPKLKNATRTDARGR